MKINGVRITGYDPINGVLLGSDNLFQLYIGQGYSVEFDNKPNETKLDAIELVKLGFTADDIIKLRNQGVI